MDITEIRVRYKFYSQEEDALPLEEFIKSFAHPYHSDGGQLEEISNKIEYQNRVLTNLITLLVKRDVVTPDEALQLIELNEFNYQIKPIVTLKSNGNSTKL